MEITENVNRNTKTLATQSKAKIPRLYFAIKFFILQQGLNITINADKTLYNFCKWQQKLNPPDDSHPNHHDVAILVTREDICSRANTPCSTLGVAHVAGMCQPDRSCSVNEDNGITLAHTITHELGHK